MLFHLLNPEYCHCPRGSSEHQEYSSDNKRLSSAHWEDTDTLPKIYIKLDDDIKKEKRDENGLSQKCFIFQERSGKALWEMWCLTTLRGRQVEKTHGGAAARSERVWSGICLKCQEEAMKKSMEMKSEKWHFAGQSWKEGYNEYSLPFLLYSTED